MGRAALALLLTLGLTACIQPGCEDDDFAGSSVVAQECDDD